MAFVYDEVKGVGISVSLVFRERKMSEAWSEGSRVAWLNEPHSVAPDVSISELVT